MMIPMKLHHLPLPQQAFLLPKMTWTCECLFFSLQLTFFVLHDEYLCFSSSSDDDDELPLAKRAKLLSGKAE
jgi:hypothetical protein